MDEILTAQQQFFQSGATRSLAFRLAQLKTLKSMIETHEQDIVQALYQDLKKPRMEAILTEILLVQNELNYVIKHLKKWMQPKKVSTPFPSLWPGKSFIYQQPYGCVFIMGAWNYPFLLIMSPLIGAMSAGNCITIKPSEIAPHTQTLIIKLIQQYFASDYIHALNANAEQTQVYLTKNWDYIFYTGNSEVGKKIMSAAAAHLTPVTLELGGKSPCIIDETANLALAARRIIWAKMINAGQTCIAPDYLYVQASCKDKLVACLIKTIKEFFGDEIEKSDSYSRIINTSHFSRLMQLMQQGHIIFGGHHNQSELYIEPTLIDDVAWQHAIMQQEIFGPLLPILTYEDEDELIRILQKQPKSLALYVFTQSKAFEQKILSNLQFGGGCINDCLMQMANLHLPFGGVGTSGLGQYHGLYSFNTFTHQQSIYKKSWLLEVRFQYPPYTEAMLRWIRKLAS